MACLGTKLSKSFPEFFPKLLLFLPFLLSVLLQNSLLTYKYTSVLIDVPSTAQM